VGSRPGLDDMEKRKFLTVPGLKLRPLGRPVRAQLLYRLRYPSSLYSLCIGITIKKLPLPLPIGKVNFLLCVSCRGADKRIPVIWLFQVVSTELSVASDNICNALSLILFCWIARERILPQNHLVSHGPENSINSERHRQRSSPQRCFAARRILVVAGKCRP
jgi:hypothetical protein